ncbi:D-2-hydroxyacid dehydrogenase [Alicyclobacillus macrosporangiidus]|uniref:D-2-hydroxyacid dehydrogenase n=1 Tax=Alicyclobacillus macrosporangiidus TaxID=392015 RepID=UPI00068A17EC|nr:D-2-hydroxyacid dehydrogenase [Alicyclobacillus macrosporangiidus]
MILIAHRLKPRVVEALRKALPEEEIEVMDRFDPAHPRLAEVEILAAVGTSLTEETIGACPNVRWLHSISAGVETVPFDLIRARGLLLTNARGAHGKQMAEQILGMMISFTRGLHYNVRRQLEHRWDRGYKLDELSGRHLVIVGAGSIGREVARKAQAFDMTITGVRRNPAPMPGFHQVVGVDALNRVLPEADFVVVLTPLTPETYHLIGEAELAAMKPSAFLINFARGDVVDEDALIRALREGRIRGAGLDVFHQEPLPAESPLWDMENVLISPHNGGWTPSHDDRFLEVFLANHRAYRAGEPLPTRVDIEARY